MPDLNTLFEQRKPLGEICSIPDKIISVYTLEKHIWAGEDAAAYDRARAQRLPAYQTIDEFQINPVRAFLNDIFRHMAAPYRPERRDDPVGQGYWIQAEFGSGKSHLLCFLAALALGDPGLWELVRKKEEQIGRGRRESLYRFWEEGLQEKSGSGKRGIFVIAKTLVGAGGGMVGLESNHRLIDYILEAAREQLYAELGKNISLYPVEILADRFLAEDLDRYRDDLRKFLRDPRFFAADEYDDIDDFLNVLQSNRAPEYKRDCGNKLWRFYTEYLKVSPHLATDAEPVLKNMVETILQEGYSGVLLILDEVSLFMKTRSDDLRQDDEATLVVLSNRLTRVYNLPVWTVCSAQQAIESKMGVRNIIADDRLKQILLLKENDDSYYEIVLSRVREIIDPAAIGNYFLFYRHHFSWPASIGEEQFRRFFPFHKPALEVLRAISANLTTARSAIHFMHETLKRHAKMRDNKLISLWQLFEETVNYEEDPSGMSEGLAAIKLQYETEYNIYIAGKRQLDGLTKGFLKFHHDKAVKSLQTFFLYYLARTRQQGILPEELSNVVLIPKDLQADPETNTAHYMIIASNLSKELRQVVESHDEEGDPRYRFEPTVTGINPRSEFQKARDEAEGNELMQNAAWQFLLGMTRGTWVAKTRQMTIDLAGGNDSPFALIAPSATSQVKDIPIEITWQGRQVSGLVGMRDLADISTHLHLLPRLNTSENDYDFAIYISSVPVTTEALEKLFAQQRDPRIILWSPAALNYDEQNQLYDLAAYRKLYELWNARDSDEAAEIISWLGRSLQDGMARILKIVDGAYGRGRIDALNTLNMDFHMGGGLPTILSHVVGRVLSAVYESRDLIFTAPAAFRPEEAVKVINGIVKTGEIPPNAKPNKDISAVNNFGLSLGIIKRGAEKRLNISSNRFVQAIYTFLEDKLDEDGKTLAIATLYHNFMGIGGPNNINYGLSRRMVQLYLLCLVQEGKIRLLLSPKAGLADTFIDYSNVKAIEFSGRILDAIIEVQKVAKPRNWELFRPFAMALLKIELPKDYDDREVASKRALLRDLFAQERENAQRIVNHSQAISEQLETQHPYTEDLQQFAHFFNTELGDDEIDEILARLDDVFGYRVFQDERSDQTEIDDFRNRYQHYHDSQQFLNHADRLRLAFAYSRLVLPENEYLKEARQIQAQIQTALKDLKLYIDSEALLRTKLLGQTRGSQGNSEGNTALLPKLISSYADVYENMHTRVLTELEKCRERIREFIVGPEIRGLAVLERVSALQPATSAEIVRRLEKLRNSILQCPEPSAGSVKAALQQQTIHKCELSLVNYEEALQHAKEVVLDAQGQLTEGLHRKLEVFLTPAIQARLLQGKDEDLIGQLLACSSVEDVQEYLLSQCLNESERVVETINRYLKRIVVKKVHLADFKAKRNLVERDQIAELAREFQAFLEGQIAAIDNEEGRDTLPILELE